MKTKLLKIGRKALSPYKKSLSSKLILPTDWEKFCALTTIRSGGVMKSFNPYLYQKLIIKLGTLHPNILILKSRQLGVTQSITAKFLHDACINEAASSILFMRNGEDASAISRRARQMLNSIPEYAKATNDNVGYLKIAGGGDLYFKNSSREGSRSLDSATGMLFDEAAFIEDIQQIYAASSPSGALSQGVIQKFIVSTPSARSGWYWDKLNENNGNIDIEQLAIDVADSKISGEVPGTYHFIDKAGCCKLILHWKAHPIYREIPNYLQYRLEQDGTDWDTILREYDLRFVDSAVAVFDSLLIRKGARGYESGYNSEKTYYAGLDTATTGNDYTCFPILAEENGEYSLVDMYRRRKETAEYHLYQISQKIRQYKIRRIGIEITGGVGQIYLEQLCKEHPEVEIVAIRTTGDSKPGMIQNLVLALEREVIEYPSDSPLVSEMLSFRRDGNKLEAAPGKHDDCVMGVAFALEISPFRKQDQTSIDFSKLGIIQRC